MVALKDKQNGEDEDDTAGAGGIIATAATTRSEDAIKSEEGGSGAIKRIETIDKEDSSKVFFPNIGGSKELAAGVATRETVRRIGSDSEEFKEPIEVKIDRDNNVRVETKEEKDSSKRVRFQLHKSKSMSPLEGPPMVMNGHFIDSKHISLDTSAMDRHDSEDIASLGSARPMEIAKSHNALASFGTDLVNKISKFGKEWIEFPKVERKDSVLGLVIYFLFFLF